MPVQNLTALSLVRTVRTVWMAVAHPRECHALAVPRVTRELIRRTILHPYKMTIDWTVIFIRDKVPATRHRTHGQRSRFALARVHNAIRQALFSSSARRAVSRNRESHPQGQLHFAKNLLAVASSNARGTSSARNFFPFLFTFVPSILSYRAKFLHLNRS